MSKYKYVLFDLDGTVSESAQGIRWSLEQAINSLDKPLPNLDDYTLYIGPPLVDTFRNLCKFNNDDCEKGMELYRNNYSTKGKFMNKLYDGVKDVLIKLKDNGVKTAVCSSKYEKFAVEIIDYLGVSDLFDAVCGSTLDGSRKDKKDLIPYAIKSLGGNPDSDKMLTVMIGDTFYDAKGAKICGVDFIGAAYGYGSIELMKNEDAAVFVETPQQLEELLL